MDEDILGTTWHGLELRPMDHHVTFETQLSLAMEKATANNDAEREKRERLEAELQAAWRRRSRSEEDEEDAGLEVSIFLTASLNMPQLKHSPT